MRRWWFLGLFLILALLPISGLGDLLPEDFLVDEGIARWYRLEDFADEPPEQAFLVESGTCQVTISFLGDCTLGGEESTASSANSFARVVEKNGDSWPFGGVEEFLSRSDLTMVNLEGVLSDRKLTKVKKKFNFRGKTAYADLLRKNGVELVTLSNNHSGDYGSQGLSDTKTALEEAGVWWIDWGTPVIWEKDGIMVGFTASWGNMSSAQAEQLGEEMSQMREAGCQYIIHSMHLGIEYQVAPSAAQRNTALKAVQAGADLVIGHHPHVVQGIGLVEGVPVVYSLGNAVFGGNFDPRDYDALLLQVTLTLEEGEPQPLQLRLVPISVSSVSRKNDYRLTPLSGKDGQRVLDKMTQSTHYTLPEFQDGGVVVDAAWLSENGE